MSGTSVVAFITNDKLKEFIKEVQDNFKELLEETNKLRGERNFESILDTQYIIRQYLVDHQDRIDFSTAGFILSDGIAKSMPSLFGLYMMVVSDLTRIQTIEDVMIQVEKRYLLHLGQKIYLGNDASGVVIDGTELQKNKLCCCSHTCSIENLAVIKNKFTNYCIVVGCACIDKNKLIDRDVMLREQIKTIKYIEKKKIADKIKEEKKQMKEGEKRRKLEEMPVEMPVEIQVDKPVDKPVEKPTVRNFTILEPRTYLDITYAKKDKAKEMGAFYDVNHKKWCIRPYCRNPQGLLKELKVIPDPRKN